MVANFPIPNGFYVYKFKFWDQKRPKYLVKIHNLYTYIEMLCLITFQFILAFICHNGLFQQKIKLS